tara:strand:- start:344 stop:1588 length:1245 start_codon:yes stop_codon:yes gene_type:complete
MARRKTNYSPKKRVRNSKVTSKLASTRRPVRKRKPTYPKVAILPKADTVAPRKIVRKKPGFDDRFEAVDKELTPFARACVIEAEKGEKQSYLLRDDFDFDLGSFSVKPAEKKRIASDGGSDEGLDLVNTEKVIRNSKGIIISKETSEEDKETYVVASTRYVFELDNYERVIDTEFSELAVMPEPLDGPNKSPIIIDVSIYPGHGTLDGLNSDGWSIQTLIDIGRPSYQVNANNNVVLYCDAYSYIDNDGTKQTEDLNFTWRFTADGLGKAMNEVVGQGPVLRLYNVQQQQRGRYTCEVSNEKGTSFSPTAFINPIGGLLQELDVNNLPTGDYIRDEDHDNQFTQFDDYWDYDLVENRWFFATWSGDAWVEGDDSISGPMKKAKPAQQYNAFDKPVVIADLQDAANKARFGVSKK